jgi:sec-independent protein translocase protein TatC
MARILKPVGHEDRLSLVEHLDELRTRLIIAVVTFAACFALCLWQNDLLLDLLNRPLEQAQRAGATGALEQVDAFQQRVGEAAGRLAAATDALARENPGAADELARASRELREAATAVPEAGQSRQPVTIGVGEPFTATVRVAAYGAFLLALPLLLYQVYAFVLPAFSPRERQVALPLMLMVPFLFVAGVAFAYLFVLPSAVSFLQNFNDDNFDILLGARDFYRFAILLLMVMGLLFQVPVGIIAVTRLGIVTPAQLRGGRRYAILVIAVLAMLLPGTDPVTMLLAMAPLVVLYEGSILLASLLDRRAARSAERAGDDDEDDWPVLYRDDD